MNRLFVRDDDSGRDVYLGAQAEVPPDIIEIASAFRSDGRTFIGRADRFRKISVDGANHIYQQVR